MGTCEISRISMSAMFLNRFAMNISSFVLYEPLSIDPLIAANFI